MMDSRIQNVGVLGTGSLKVKEFCTGVCWLGEL